MDSSNTVDERVQALLMQMTLEEKQVGYKSTVQRPLLVVSYLRWHLISHSALVARLLLLPPRFSYCPGALTVSVFWLPRSLCYALLSLPRFLAAHCSRCPLLLLPAFVPLSHIAFAVHCSHCPVAQYHASFSPLPSATAASAWWRSGPFVHTATASPMS